MEEQKFTRIQLISLFSLNLRKGYEDSAKDNLDKFYDQHIKLEKSKLNRNIDPTTELQPMN